MSDSPIFTESFDKYACIGETITAEHDGFELTATLYHDDDSDPPWHPDHETLVCRKRRWFEVFSMSADPTMAEMRDFLANHPLAAEADDFDVAEAIYWFAADSHGGQWSNLYEALSASDYAPGPMRSGPEPDSIAADLFAALETEYLTESTAE